MEDHCSISLELYLKSRGVEKINGLDDNEYKVDNEATLKQLKNISEFHKAASGYFEYKSTKLSSCIGKDIEDCKVKSKKLKRNIEDLKRYGTSNKFEDLLLNDGYEYMKRAERCIDVVNDSNYIFLVSRSMERKEVCLGNTSFDNLINKQGLKVMSLERCCYNMVETDAIYFLSKLKRKNIDLDWNSLLDDYCNFEELDGDSKTMILALLSYPYEFIKCFNRYRKNTKDWTVKKYCKRAQQAMIKDGESLI